MIALLELESGLCSGRRGDSDSTGTFSYSRILTSSPHPITPPLAQTIEAGSRKLSCCHMGVLRHVQ